MAVEKEKEINNALNDNLYRCITVSFWIIETIIQIMIQIIYTISKTLFIKSVYPLALQSNSTWTK